MGTFKRHRFSIDLQAILGPDEFALLASGAVTLGGLGLVETEEGKGIGVGKGPGGGKLAPGPGGLAPAPGGVGVTGGVGTGKPPLPPKPPPGVKPPAKPPAKPPLKGPPKGPVKPPPKKGKGPAEAAVMTKTKKLAWDPIEDPTGTAFMQAISDYFRDLPLGDLEEAFAKQAAKKGEEKKEAKAGKVRSLSQN
eukprot:Gregarina_sp_Poly_1__4223@NODE_2302_length_2332_cov_17_217660_g1475_i0_p1_GENE_NODE_2302_length_2332_cov_17_217660_g1475_i0NODE_2302_length_2332_cov_17_217660_g1475_i0_p1_ORF_typecomplete_len193_score28_30FH2/PF02181_23/0_13_NODE_2302_length_2332_cov_17_217660_g1475_i013001878